MKISNEFKIGLMAILVIGLSVWGYMFLKGRNVLKAANEYFVRFENIDALATSSPVLIHGYQVGTVSAIDLEEDLNSIIITLTLDKELRIPKDAEALIFSTSIMGGKAIDLRVSGACSGAQCAEPGSFIQGRVKGIFDSLLDKGEDGTLAKVKESISDILKTVSDSITSDSSNNALAKTFNNLSGLIENLESVTGSLDKSMSVYDKSLTASLKNIEVITGAIARNQDKIASSIQNLESITAQLEKAKLGETTSNINKLVTDAQVTVLGLNKSVAESQKAFTNLAQVMQNVEDGKGTLGKLIKDDRLYDRALATTKNLELLLQDFRLNPKRYVSVSVFGKKQSDYEVPENDPALQIEPEKQE
ncbi:MAG: MlaD family protein [Bacteroidota bacterium]|nr:MlaD family protein [Bacteroidota bacterium]